MAPVSISKRSARTPASPIRKLTPLARDAKARGTKVYQLNIGQPDIASPQEFFAGLSLYRDSVVAYDPSDGRGELREAWSSYMNKSLGLHTVPENFLITTGGSEALIFSFLVCCDPGDEILVFDPTYANYISFAVNADVKLVPVPSDIENNFALPPVERILSRITDKTKAILLCNPNNPTGTVYSPEEIQFLLDLCAEENLFLIVDETYREFVYDGKKPHSVLHNDPENDRVVIVDSLSKRFSLCGARIGAIISTNQMVIAAGLKFAQARLASPTIDQFAAAHMLRTISPKFIENVRVEYGTRRDALFAAVSQLPGVTLQKPQGAFYAVARLPLRDAEDFARFMLADFSHKGATTFVAPAAGFYLTPNRGQNEVRVAYVLNCEEIRAAVEILGQGLLVYQAKHASENSSSQFMPKQTLQ